MKNELFSKTLAQIVDENHKAAAIFEKYDLDFCCKGKRSLQLPAKKGACLLKQLQKSWGLHLIPMDQLRRSQANFHWPRWQIILFQFITITQDKNYLKFFITCKRYLPNMGTGIVN